MSIWQTSGTTHSNNLRFLNSHVPKDFVTVEGVTSQFGSNLGPKLSLDRAKNGVSETEGQQIQRDFGGSVWESNPPLASRRDGSPALKAGKVTGPISPPQLQYHQNTTLSGYTQPLTIFARRPTRRTLLLLSNRARGTLTMFPDRSLCEL